MSIRRCPICQEPVEKASIKTKVVKEGSIVCENEHYIHVMYQGRSFMARTHQNIWAELEDSGLFNCFC